MPMRSDDKIFLARECTKCLGTGELITWCQSKTEISEMSAPYVCGWCEGRGFNQVAVTVDDLVKYIADGLLRV